MSAAPRPLVTLLAAASIALAGCATTGAPDSAGGSVARSAVDPLEPLNRTIFALNDAIDGVFTKPVAKVYQTVVPEVLRNIVGNVFSNVGDLWIAANQLMQGKPTLALRDLTRFVVNTTYGFVGFADVATSLGLEKHSEDFGQTLGVWGVPAGPYVVLPMLGPSSVRDGIGWVADIYTDPVAYTDPVSARNTAYGARFVDKRASFFPAERVVEGAMLDKYSFIRDAYLQRRRNQVFDGNPPEEPGDDPGADEGAGKDKSGSTGDGARMAGSGSAADQGAAADKGAAAASTN